MAQQYCGGPVMINDGRIVERGTHRELVERDGLYATLYERQFRSSAELSAVSA
jgi:ATP-binding cassette, subfamily B, bacterial